MRVVLDTNVAVSAILFEHGRLASEIGAAVGHPLAPQCHEVHQEEQRRQHDDDDARGPTPSSGNPTHVDVDAAHIRPPATCCRR